MNVVRRQGVLLAVAVQFLTRLPTPRIALFEPDMPVRAARYYPLVGHLVGAICAVVWLGALRLWNAPVAAVSAVVAGMLITGGFHEDGLADTADGLGGGQTAERRLEIMKDSRIGSYGALALIASALLRVSALASLAPAAGALALVVAHGAARATAVMVMGSTPYVGDIGAAKGRAAGVRVRGREMLAAAVIGFAPLALLPLRQGVVASLLVALAATALALTARRLIGGHTGDVLGGVEQVAETALLLGASA